MGKDEGGLGEAETWCLNHLNDEGSKRRSKEKLKISVKFGVAELQPQELVMGDLKGDKLLKAEVTLKSFVVRVHPI